MSLADDVAAVFARLAPIWRLTFEAHGCRLDPTDLAALERPLPAIDRSVPGFEDFAPSATRAIEPGDPALSLVYHAFASANVHPIGGPAVAADYPTLAELDLIENYIYSRAPFAPNDLTGLSTAVFAYEYRPAPSTGHRTHADLMFSRTGVARVGDRPMVWSPPARCFLNQASGQPGTFAVMPARYGVFLAKSIAADHQNISLVGQWDGDDAGRQFLYPVRKLFDGPDCIAGFDLRVAIEEYHRAEKLARIVTVGGMKLKNGFDVNTAPFVRESGSDSMVEIAPQTSGGSVLVSSPPAPVVRYARQRNTLSSDVEPVSFEVPAAGLFFRDFSINRHYSTLMLVENWWTFAIETVVNLIGTPRSIAPRNVPNFVNIRHEVRDPRAPPVDLNAPGGIPGGETYENYIAKGGYQAAMFEDSICDGALWASVSGLPGDIPLRAAFSIVTAPDFFPFADELHLNNHTDVTQDQFSAGGPTPLCEGRYRVNPAVLRAAPRGVASPDLDDQTFVAIVGRPKRTATSVQPPRERGSFVGRSVRTTSYLTDAASNEFAPGWDVTFGGDLFKKFYTTYGLGSPFPEDVKLCAAANSFWPAAAPDASRTFDRQATPTAIPMLDEELGYHHDDPDKPANVRSAPGWDGEYGPFFEYLDDGERVVNHSDIWRSDYVTNAQAGTFRPDPFRNIDASELIARMDCLRLCIKSLPAEPHIVKNTKLWLVTAQRVDDWAAVPNNHTLAGPGYKFVFVRPVGKPVPVPGDPKRARQSIDRTGYVCHVTPNQLYWSKDGDVFHPARN